MCRDGGLSCPTASPAAAPRGPPEEPPEGAPGWQVQDESRVADIWDIPDISGTLW